MSLHIEIHEFSRPNLVIALIALVYLREVGLLFLYPCTNLLVIQKEIRDWAGIQRESQDQYFKTFKKFIDLYCAGMVPENFDLENWAESLSSEMCFASQFFAFPAQYSEPYCRKKRIVVKRKVENQVREEYAWIEEWLTQEHYAAAHQYTQQSWLPDQIGTYPSCRFVVDLLPRGYMHRRTHF